MLAFRYNIQRSSTHWNVFDRMEEMKYCPYNKTKQNITKQYLIKNYQSVSLLPICGKISKDRFLMNCSVFFWLITSSQKASLFSNLVTLLSISFCQWSMKFVNILAINEKLRVFFGIIRLLIKFAQVVNVQTWAKRYIRWFVKWRNWFSQQ